MSLKRERLRYHEGLRSGRGLEWAHWEPVIARLEAAMQRAHAALEAAATSHGSRAEVARTAAAALDSITAAMADLAAARTSRTQRSEDHA